MDNYVDNLQQAINRQAFVSNYELHISSPLLEYAPQQRNNKEEKKGDSISIRLPPSTRKDLEEIANKNNTSISQLIYNAITNSILKHMDTEKARKIYLENIENQRKAVPAPKTLRDVLSEPNERTTNSTPTNPSKA